MQCSICGEAADVSQHAKKRRAESDLFLSFFSSLASCVHVCVSVTLFSPHAHFFINPECVDTVAGFLSSHTVFFATETATMSVARHGTHSNSSLQTYNVSVCTSGPCSSLSRFHACVSAILVRVGSASLSFRLQVSPRTGLETGRMLDATGMKANGNLENNSLKEWIEI